MCEIIPQLLGVIIGGALGIAGSYFAQRSANKAGLEQIKYSTYKDKQASFYEDCAELLAVIKTDHALLLDKQVYLSFLSLQVKADIYSSKETNAAFEVVCHWITELQKAYFDDVEEIKQKYFDWIEIPSSDEETPPQYEYRFIGSDFKQYECECERCEREHIPSQIKIDAELKPLIDQIHQDVATKVKFEKDMLN